MYNNNNTDLEQSQEEKILQKLLIKKGYNKKVVSFLQDVGELERAYNVEHCGEHVGITTIDGIAKIVKADFCRERICSVCAWRRQAKFTAQTFPIISILEDQSYRFIFVTLTLKNMRYEELKLATDTILRGYELLRKRRKIKRAWKGIIRSMELSYNAEQKTFHPHLHLLVAVRENYFTDSDQYITQAELTKLWGDCIDVDYNPICNIKIVDDSGAGAVESLKYSLKPTQAREAFSAFFYILRGRRLVSFCGVFAKLRKELRFSDFENVLTDDVERTKRITYNLYTFDATGGVYRFNKKYEIL